MSHILAPQRCQILCRLVQGSVALLLTAVPVLAQNQLWIDQFGREMGDGARAAIGDGSGGAFVCGYAEGDPLGWFSSLYRDDVVLARYDASGDRLWTQVLSSPGWEYPLGMAPDGTGGFFVVGQLCGPFGGATSGFIDSWLARFDSSGARQWFHNLGGAQRVLSAAPDGAGGTYLVGNTLGLVDAWLGRFDSAGNKLWSVTTRDDEWYDFKSATPDGAGGVFVCGSKSVYGPSGLDVQGGLARYDGSGIELWSVEFGGPNGWDEAHVVLSDGVGGAFVSGRSGAAWVSHYDSNGTQLWFAGVGSQGEPVAMATDGTGGFYVSVGVGLGGVLLNRHDSAGNLVWTHQIASQGTNYLMGPIGPWALAWDGGSGVFVGGSTEQDLGGPNAGGTDFWLARYEGSCNSGEMYCKASTTSIPGCQAAISGAGSPSMSNPSTFTISSGNVPGNSFGICFFSTSAPTNMPFGTLGGKLCMKHPISRSAPKPSGGSTGACDGAYSFTLQDLIDASSIVTSGAVIRAEIWARDGANPDGFLLSNGLKFCVSP
jgi:hypothetical protein